MVAWCKSRRLTERRSIEDRQWLLLGRPEESEEEDAEEERDQTFTSINVHSYHSAFFPTICLLGSR
jgi:hypothetical protein